jgi:hypothetical protein
LTTFLTVLLSVVLSFGRVRGADLSQQIESMRQQREELGARTMPGITPEELANLLDSGLDPNEISYLCFTRWRFRRGDLNEGICLPNQLMSRSLALAGPGTRNKTQVV